MQKLAKETKDFNDFNIYNDLNVECNNSEMKIKEYLHGYSQKSF